MTRNGFPVPTKDEGDSIVLLPVLVSIKALKIGEE